MQRGDLETGVRSRPIGNSYRLREQVLPPSIRRHPKPADLRSASGDHYLQPEPVPQAALGQARPFAKITQARSLATPLAVATAQWLADSGSTASWLAGHCAERG